MPCDKGASGGKRLEGPEDRLDISLEKLAVFTLEDRLWVFLVLWVVEFPCIIELFCAIEPIGWEVLDMFAAAAAAALAFSLLAAFSWALFSFLASCSLLASSSETLARPELLFEPLKN